MLTNQSSRPRHSELSVRRAHLLERPQRLDVGRAARRAPREQRQQHEGGDGHVWWVDSLFFLGFLGSFLLEKAVDASGGR